jgi:hypothetical protein
MMLRKSQSLLLSLALAGLSIGACGGDDDDNSGNTPDSGNATFDAGTEFQCDPVGANAAQGTLFNAPVADDVEVIVKEPTHPGAPGPTDLP